MFNEIIVEANVETKNTVTENAKPAYCHSCHHCHHCHSCHHCHNCWRG